MVSFSTDGKAIFIIFVGAIATIILLGAIADQIFAEVNTITITNVTITAAAENTTLDVTGRDLLTVVEIYNSTNISQSYIGNGTNLQSGTSTTTALRSVQFIVNATGAGPSIAGTTVNISYTANPDGYISDLGSRSIANLIPIFSALAILIFLLVVLIKEGTLGKLIRGS